MRPQNYSEGPAKSSYAPDIEALLGGIVLPDPFAGMGRRFVAWREEITTTDDGKTRKAKVPYAPKSGRKASATDATTWGLRKTAKARAAKLLAGGKTGGIGVVLGKLDDGSHLSGVDLDGCRDPETGVLAPWADEIVKRFGTYAEVSPSGTGVKLFFLLPASDTSRSRIAFDGNISKTWKSGHHLGIEAYLDGRYFTITGDVLPGYPELATVEADTLEWMVGHANTWKAAQPKAKAAEAQGGGTRDESGSGHGYRFFLNLARAAPGTTEDDALEAIREDENEAGEWAARASDRELSRTWERAADKAERDRESRALEWLDMDDEGRDVIGLAPIDPTTRRLNGRHAIVRHGGKTLVADLGDGMPELGPVGDLQALYANVLVPKRGDTSKAWTASQHWLSDPNRRTYDDVVFDPSGRAAKTALNLWQGWAVTPDPSGSCDRILDHVRDVWAAGNADHARYILGFLADLFQNPGRKPDVALVLKGAKGAGKDIIVEVLKRIIGHRHVAHIDHPDRLTGRFNAHFATAMLAHVEEAFWGGARDKSGVLQSLITGQTMNLEKKGIDAVTVDSFVRFIMTTNESWAVPATAGERRYAVFDVSGHRCGDRDYFAALWTEIANGGPEAFLAYLLAYDLDGFQPRDVPQTDALRDQKLAGLKGVARFVFDMLDRGDEEGEDTWEGEVERGELHGRYVEFMRSTPFQGDVVNRNHFGVELRKIIPNVADKRPRVNGKPGPMAYVLPPLADCRAAFSDWIGHAVSWEGGE